MFTLLEFKSNAMSFPCNYFLDGDQDPKEPFPYVKDLERYKFASYCQLKTKDYNRNDSETWTVPDSKACMPNFWVRFLKL